MPVRARPGAPAKAVPSRLMQAARVLWKKSDSSQLRFSPSLERGHDEGRSMRMHHLLKLAAAFALAGAPVFASAQFQAPTPEELAMRSEAKAPGADAIYLYYEEVDNDPLHYQSIYARIKVLTEKGKE